LVIVCIVFPTFLFAQTPKQIEADLLKSFNRIGYWEEKTHDTTATAWAANDSLNNANDILAMKLKYYAEKFPSMIGYPFASLKKEYLDISTSSDGLFRIYSWDTWTGGTMHVFENVMQYRSGKNTKAIIDIPKSEGDIPPTYDKIYTFKTGGKTYYLTTYLFIESSRYSAYGITAFTIAKDKVIEAKIIKTHSGFHSGLSYECDFATVQDRSYDKLPEMHFDNTTNTISLPLMSSKGAFTKKFILYKFTGQYFERVKN